MGIFDLFKTKDSEFYIERIEWLTKELDSCKKEIDRIRPRVPVKPKNSYVSPNAYKGDLLVYTKTGYKTIKLKKLQHYFSFSMLLLDEVIKPTLEPAFSEKTKPLSLLSEEEVDLIKWELSLNWVQNNIKYITDKNKFGVIENWEPPLNVYITCEADCESMSMLVIALCNAWGVSSERLFFESGEFTQNNQKFGHALTCFVLFTGIRMIGDATGKKKPFSEKLDEGKKYNPIWGLGNKDFELMWVK